MSIKIKGEVMRIIFANSDNNYRIFTVANNDNTYTLCGYIPKLEEGLTYEFDCEETYHARYGNQYKVLTYQSVMENSKEGIINYLSSNLFPGVGLICAEKVYDTLGENCLEIIEKDPNSLEKVKGITKNQKETIYVKILENRIIETTFVKLYQMGLSNKMVMELYEKYREETLDIIEENPYRLIYDLEGIGFKKADELAMKLNFPLDHKERLKALLVFTMRNICAQYGLTYLNTNQLITTAYNYALAKTNISIDILPKYLNEAVSDKRLIIENDRIYIPSIYYSEVKIANKINQMQSLPNKKIKRDRLDSLLSDFESMYSIKFSAEQHEAIINALTNRVSIVTGGPGTGKTTIIKAIINLYSALSWYNLYDDEAFYKILLCAPTGKASKRITEQTLFKASTIHKALGYSFEGDFAFDSENPLPHQLIIVDEVSMIDTILASHLMDAVSVNAQIVFVGDVFQLPSIAPGAVLKDLIESNNIPTTYLKTIYRQGAGSNIIKLSDMVKDGNVDINIFNKDSDLIYVKSFGNNILDNVNEIINENISLGYDLYDDIQVLAPMYKGVCGIDQLNRSISDNFNLDYSYSLEHKDKLFKENDKVIQLVNSSELQILNGDMGILGEQLYIQVDDKDKMVYDVSFSEKRVKIPQKEFDNLNLAYAVSIHKSQGSEFKVVILVLNKSFSVMLKRKLIYTAITRAKEKLYIVGDIDAFYQGLKEIEANRQTSLSLRFVKKSTRKKINDPEIPFDDLGEINMEGITPYSFMV